MFKLQVIVFEIVEKSFCLNILKVGFSPENLVTGLLLHSVQLEKRTSDAVCTFEVLVHVLESCSQFHHNRLFQK